MIRGLYLSGTGMLTQRNKMDVITNNLANVDTPGFREERMLSRSFQDLLIERQNDPAVIRADREVGDLGTGIHIDEIGISYKQGALEQTDLTTDVAIEGNGFFVVNTPDGERYTRAGNFHITADGLLVNNEGLAVQGEGGDITLESDRFTITENGRIFDADSNQEVATLRIVEFENPENLRKQAGSLFYEYEDAGMTDPAENSVVVQGFLEMSNVETAQQMVDMIIASRAYESSQRAVSMIDETLDRAVNDIARF